MAAQAVDAVRQATSRGKNNWPAFPEQMSDERRVSVSIKRAEFDRVLRTLNNCGDKKLHRLGEAGKAAGLQRRRDAEAAKAKLLEDAHRMYFEIEAENARLVLQTHMGPRPSTNALEMTYENIQRMCMTAAAMAVSQAQSSAPERSALAIEDGIQPMAVDDDRALQAELQEKDEEIDDLKDKLKQKTDELDDLEEEVDDTVEERVNEEAVEEWGAEKLAAWLDTNKAGSDEDNLTGLIEHLLALDASQLTDDEPGGVNARWIVDKLLECDRVKRYIDMKCQVDHSIKNSIFQIDVLIHNWIPKNIFRQL